MTATYALPPIFLSQGLRSKGNGKHYIKQREFRADVSLNSSRFIRSSLVDLLQKSHAIHSWQGQTCSVLQASVFFGAHIFLKKFNYFQKNRKFAGLTTFLLTLIMYR